MRNDLFTPQRVSQNLDLTQWGVSPEQIKILAHGPENAAYWPTWESILNSARKVVNGEYYSLFECTRGILIVDEDFDPEARAF